MQTLVRKTFLHFSVSYISTGVSTSSRIITFLKKFLSFATVYSIKQAVSLLIPEFFKHSTILNFEYFSFRPTFVHV